MTTVHEQDSTSGTHRNSVVVIGCGDHARVVHEIFEASGVHVEGCVDPEPSNPERPTRSPLLQLGNFSDRTEWIGRWEFRQFVVALGSNSARQKAFEHCVGLGLRPVVAIHPTAILLKGSTVEPGAQICAGAIVGVDSVVRENAIVNTAASVDHDNEIGAHASIAPGVRLAGRVIVGMGAHVGIGASVRERIRIGEWAVVGAGAVVIKDVGAHERVAGVPARPLRTTRSDRG